MKPVKAQFRPVARPGAWHIALLVLLALLLVAAVAAAAWQRWRVESLRRELSVAEERRSAGQAAPPPRPEPPYASSAREMLHERAAAWAPMLRTLENAAVIGVTPTRVEFNAADGSARVELVYSDPNALFEYLEMINEGVSPKGDAKWKVVQIRADTGAGGQQRGPLSGNQSSAAVAEIRSVWSPELTSR
jgi:hypothetical protein